MAMLSRSEILPALRASVRKDLPPMTDEEADLLIAVMWGVATKPEQLDRAQALVRRTINIP